MTRGKIFLVSLLLLCAPALADIHPNNAPGFPVEQSFHVGDIDNVNLFNGSLTLTIPLGGSYPVGGGFSYSLKLVYNGNPWSFVSLPLLDPWGNQIGTRTAAEPGECSNAGLGWRVSLGRMDPPCQTSESAEPPPVYQDENGTDHIFYPTLHYGDPEDVNPAGVTDVQYTRDGSYLRLKVYSAGYREIELPDGTIRRFNSEGLPTQIRDSFSNTLSITYPAGQWVLTDSQGRVHTISFGTAASFPVVTRVDLQAFNGQTATYQLQYTEQQVGRACPHDDTAIANSATVPLLTGVLLPDGSSYQAAVSDYITSAGATTASCTDAGGNLIGLTLPTLGRLEWTWQKYQFPSGSAQKPRLQRNDGVAARTMRDPSRPAGQQVLGTWTYVPFPNTLGAKEHTVTVTDPLGHRTVHYFSVATDAAFTGAWSRYDYSLPFTRNQAFAGVPDLLLSRQVYNASNTLLRSEYVQYERDPFHGTSPPNSTHTNRRMLRGRTVYHDDGGIWSGTVYSNFDGLGHYRQQETEGSFPSGSNVRGHFGNYNPAQGTYVVNLAANTASGYSLFPAISRWVLETMTYASDTEGAQTAQVDFCYAPNSATVMRRRVHRSDGATPSAQDLVTVYDLDSNNQGNVITEKSYGGDVQGGAGGSDLCTMTLPASPEYQIDHAWSYGVKATSQYAGTNFKILDQTIDPRTGLVLSSRDSAEIQTDYEYDALGRMTWLKPTQGHGGWTQYLYSAAVTPATVTVRRRDNGSKSATIRATEFYLFDAFGRVSKQQRQLPSGTSTRETTYDGAGNKATVSEAAFGSSPANKTYFLSYDPFGRPGTLRPPDGASHDVTMTYQGVRQVSRAVKITTNAGGGETSSTTTEVYDRHGRLISVSEPSGSGGAVVTTSYGYDVGNRLTSVSMPAQSRSFTYDRAGLLQSETHPEKGASGNGTVSYPQYDSRSHARRKTDGPNDLVFTYDAAERLSEVKEQGTNLLLKSFSYAPSNGGSDWSKGKLRTASRYNYVTVGGGAFTIRVDETYTYGGLDGRVSQRNSDFHVSASGGPFTAQEKFTQSFTYNSLGLVSTQGYPICTHAGCTAAAPVFADVPAGHPDQREIEAIYPVKTAPSTPRNLQLTYSQGLLTGVSANGVSYGTVTYHPNLLVSQIAHTNGVTETQGNDPNDMRRPASLTASGPYASWSSGTYTYDGAGNIKSIGTSAFTYDKVNRLVAASLYDGPTGGGNLKQQSYTFDAYGNITGITTNGILRNTPTSATTNRLTGAVTYDAAGSLTSWNGATYQYDRFNQMTRMTSGSEDWTYIYTADDERIWSYSAGLSRWALRDLDGKVLREYLTDSRGWSVGTDYLYRNGLLMAAETQTGRRHFHLDHLGTPRLITRASGDRAAYHVYYPFGEEATAFNQDSERMKFTGHERDLGSAGGAGDDLDYMHARHCSPVTGRFGSVDKADVLSLQRGDEEERKRFHQYLEMPQSWNRYAYAHGNPLKYIDPDGESAELAIAGGLFGGSEAAAGGGILAGTAAPLVIAVGAGVGLGLAVNQVPGVSEALTIQQR